MYETNITFFKMRFNDFPVNISDLVIYHYK